MINLKQYFDSISHLGIEVREEFHLNNGVLKLDFNGVTDNTGDIYFRKNDGYVAPLAIGQENYVLTSKNGLPSWEQVIIPTSFTWEQVINKPNNGDFIFNQFAVAQSPGSFWINGKGRIDGSFTDTIGSNVYTAFQLSPTLNQTGTATGDMFGYRYNPTITNIIGKHWGLSVEAGDVQFLKPLNQYIKYENDPFGAKLDMYSAKASDPTNDYSTYTLQNGWFEVTHNSPYAASGPGGVIDNLAIGYGFKYKHRSKKVDGEYWSSLDMWDGISEIVQDNPVGFTQMQLDGENAYFRSSGSGILSYVELHKGEQNAIMAYDTINNLNEWTSSAQVKLNLTSASLLVSTDPDKLLNTYKGLHVLVSSGDIKLDKYPSTRNDGTITSGQHILYTDASGNLKAGPINFPTSLDWSNVTNKPNDGNYIHNQNTAAQTSSNYWISGTGRAESFRADTTTNYGAAFIGSGQNAIIRVDGTMGGTTAQYQVARAGTVYGLFLYNSANNRMWLTSGAPNGLYISDNNMGGTVAAIFETGSSANVRTRILGGFTASSGSTAYEALQLAPTINQTGTASGTVYGIHYNPTLTSVLGTHYGLYINSGLNYFSGNTGIGAVPNSTFKLLVSGDAQISNSRGAGNLVTFGGAPGGGVRVGSGTYYLPAAISVAGRTNTKANPAFVIGAVDNGGNNYKIYNDKEEVNSGTDRMLPVIYTYNTFEAKGYVGNKYITEIYTTDGIYTENSIGYQFQVTSSGGGAVHESLAVMRWLHQGTVIGSIGGFGFRLDTLAGTGDRMVVVDSAGLLKAQAIPSGNAGSVTSVGATVTASTALTVTGSPIISSGSLDFSWTGAGTQYVKGDGTLATLNWAAIPDKPNNGDFIHNQNTVTQTANFRISGEGRIASALFVHDYFHLYHAGGIAVYNNPQATGHSFRNTSSTVVFDMGNGSQNKSYNDFWVGTRVYLHAANKAPDKFLTERISIGHSGTYGWVQSYNDGSPLVLNGNTSGPVLLGTLTASANTERLQVSGNSLFTGSVTLNGSFVANAGSTTYTATALNPTINQTGTANGPVYGIHYNPTVTSVIGTHYGIYIASGKNWLQNDTTIGGSTSFQEGNFDLRVGSNVVIGNNTNNAVFQLRGNSQANINFFTGGNANGTFRNTSSRMEMLFNGYIFYSLDGSTEYARMLTDGRLLLGTTSNPQSARIYASGTIHATSTLITGSGVRTTDPTVDATAGPIMRIYGGRSYGSATGTGVEFYTSGSGATAGTFNTEVLRMSIAGGTGSVFMSSLNDNTDVAKMVVTTNGVLSYQDIPSGSSGGEANTASNLGTTTGREGLFVAKSGADLQFKSLVAGSNVTFDTSVSGELKIDVTTAAPAWSTVTSKPNDGNFIFNQNASAQTANSWITGNSRSGSITTDGNVAASGAIARGVYLNNTLTATANNDVLIALDIVPTFSAGSFTGVQAAGIRLPNNTPIVGLGTTGNQMHMLTTIGTGTVVLGSSAYATRVQGSNVPIFVGTTQVGVFHSTSGNLTLQNGGTFTDAGYRLDVNGTSRLAGSVNASSGMARGAMVSPTLTAVANGDTLIAMDIVPTYTVGSFTGTTSLGIRTRGAVRIEPTGGGASMQLTHDGTNAYINTGSTGLYLQQGSANKLWVTSTAITAQEDFIGNTSGSKTPMIHGFALNTHPEADNGMALIPFINNDLAYNRLRGGVVTDNMDTLTGGTTSNTTFDAMFDGSPRYAFFDPSTWTGGTSYVLTVDFHTPNLFNWSYSIGVSFGNTTWRAKSITLELFRTDTNTWFTVDSVTNWAKSIYNIRTGNIGGNFVSKMRWTFSDFATSTGFRIAQVWLQYYNSTGAKETLMGRDGGALYGGITPNTNGTLNLGSTSNNFSVVHSNQVHSNGTLTFNTTNSNSIGYWIGGTERMRVYGGTGNVVMQNGGTYADNGFRLEVVGTSRFTDLMNLRRQGDGLELLRFDTERAWGFFQQGTGASTELVLRSSTGSKYFRIQSSSLTNALTVYTSNGGSDVNTVAINANGTSSSAVFQVDSTTRGVLLTRMTAAQRDAIASPATGLITYQTDGTEGMYVKLSGAWRRFLTDADGPAGANTSIQFNDNGIFGGVSDFTWDKTNKRLTVVGDIYTNGSLTSLPTTGTQRIYGFGNYTINTGQTYSNGSVFASGISRMDYNLNSASTLPKSTVHSANFNWLRLTSAVSSTITVEQGNPSGIRAISANAVQIHINQITSDIATTVDHVAGMQIYSLYQDNGTTNSVKITNYYGLLIADTHANVDTLNNIPVTNRYAILQEGSQDRNKFKGVIETSNDVEITDSTKGIIMKSPNGNRWRITINDLGTLVSTQI